MKIVPRLAVAGVTLAALTLVAPAAAAADTQPPTTPTNVRVLNVTPTVVTIAFDRSTDNEGLKWYSVRAPHRHQYTTSPGGTQFGGLMSETTYSLTVVAIDKAGNESTPSEPVTFTTGAWAAPGGLRVTSAAGGEVSLAWNRLTQMDPYRFLVFDGGRAEAVTTREQVTMKGLAAGTHTFTVKGFHVTGSVTLPSHEVTVTVPPRGGDLAAPSAPGDPTATVDEEDYDFTTTWTASTDPGDPSSSLRYDLLQHWAGDLFAVAYGVSGTTNTGVFASAVRAVDPAGNRSAAAPVMVLF